jgi:uncharacterized membrane protein
MEFAVVSPYLSRLIAAQFFEIANQRIPSDCPLPKAGRNKTNRPYGTAKAGQGHCRSGPEAGVHNRCVPFQL